MPSLPSLLSRCPALLIAPLVFLVAPHCPAPAQAPGTKPDDELVPFGPPRLTLTTIVARYGPPSQRVGADLWIYWNFPANSAVAKHGEYDTLIVHIDGEYARAMRLVRAPDLRALLHRIGRANQAAITVPGR